MCVFFQSLYSNGFMSDGLTGVWGSSRPVAFSHVPGFPLLTTTAQYPVSKKPLVLLFVSRQFHRKFLFGANLKINFIHPERMRNWLGVIISSSLHLNNYFRHHVCLSFRTYTRPSVHTSHFNFFPIPPVVSDIVKIKVAWHMLRVKKM